MLSNIYNALHDGGFLLFFEMTTVLPTLLWGLDAQCWNFEDEREFGLWVNRERWERLLEEVGFAKVRARSARSLTYLSVITRGLPLTTNCLLEEVGIHKQLQPFRHMGARVTCMVPFCEIHRKIL